MSEKHNQKNFLPQKDRNSENDFARIAKGKNSQI